MIHWASRSFLRRLTLSSTLLVIVTAGLVGITASRIARAYLTQEVAARLRAQGNLLRNRLSPEGIEKGDFKNLDAAADRMGFETGARATIIGVDGHVLGDSEVSVRDLVSVGSHVDRVEVRDALASGFGTAVRRSETIGLDFLYAALPIRHNGVSVATLRLALPLSDVHAKVAALQKSIALWAGLSLIVALLLAVYVSRSVHEPLGQIVVVAQKMAGGDYSARLPTRPDDELGILGDALRSLSHRVSDTIGALSMEKVQLKRLEDVRREFVANVSHELRTPLAAIKGFSETLRRGAIDDLEHRMEFIEGIERHADRLTGLVDDLLELASIESEKRDIRKEPILLREFAQSIWNAIAPIAKKREVSFVNEVDGSLEISFDRKALDQVLQNLISNAVKYNREGGHVVIDAARTDTGEVRVSVRDVGIGIPVADLARIFERFYRVDKARSREMGGTGLGLSIVKHIVEKHGGSILAESAEGDGTTIRFLVPS